jgi:hypothetical protein
MTELVKPSGLGPIWYEKVVESIRSELGGSSALVRLIVPKRLGQADLAVAANDVERIRETFAEPHFEEFSKEDPIVQFFMGPRAYEEAMIWAIGDVGVFYDLARSQLKSLDGDICEWLEKRVDHLKRKKRADHLKELGDFNLA